MRHRSVACVVALLAAALAVPAVHAASAPEVASVIEGKDTASERRVLVLMGNKLTKFKAYELRDPLGVEVFAPLTLMVRSKAMIVLGLPEGLAQGDYDLVATWGRGVETTFPVTVTNGVPLPGIVAAPALEGDLRDDLDDAETLGGMSPAEYRNASNLDSGTVSTDRFSAWDDLMAESRLGTGPGKAAYGDHDHDEVYPLRTELSTPGTANDPGNPVDWTRLKNIPADLQDGDMDTTYSAGTGLSLTGTVFSTVFGGNGTAGNSSRSDHNHDATYLGLTGGSLTGGVSINAATGRAVYGYAQTGDAAIKGENPSATGVGVIAEASGTALRANHYGASGDIAQFQAGGTTVARIDRAGKAFFNGGVDGLTTYSAGTGLSLTGTVFSTVFGGNGSAGNSSRSDHNHDAAYLGLGGGTLTGPLDATAAGTALSGTVTGTGFESAGVRGNATASGNDLVFGVFGSSSSTHSGSAGVRGDGPVGVRGYSGSTSGVGAYGFALASTGATFGLVGQTSSTAGIGAFGSATASTGSTIGVKGASQSSAGTGVFGEAPHATSGTVAGVHGKVSTTGNGSGVRGESTGTTGNNYGVLGTNASATGRGVMGDATHTTGTNFGVIGRTLSSAGRGVYGEAASTAAGGTAIGVYGESATEFGRGVYGVATHASGVSLGIFGVNHSTAGIGVKGEITATTGSSIAVEATNPSTSGKGMHTRATATTGTTYGLFAENASSAGTAVHGENSSASGTTFGVRGRSASSAGGACGVIGENTATSGNNYGTFGSAASATGRGVMGDALHTTGANFGVIGRSASSAGTGVYAESSGTAMTANHVGTTGNPAIFQSGGTNVARIDKTGKGFFNGGTQTGGADFAESVAVARPKREFEPGDVMVISTKADRTFDLSTEPRSALVAGVYSTKPGVLAMPRDVAGDEFLSVTKEVPLAVVGIVPTKVCDEGGPIRRGDLLVTASRPGHAMRAPANPEPGTVLGKSLGTLEKGTGRIEVYLVSR